MNRTWTFSPLNDQQRRDEAALAKKYAGVNPVSQLLVQRGISTIDDAERFFKPSLRDLHDPYLMPDMDKAVNRLNRALGSKEKIMVYGDYDVDGTTAVALVYKFLQNFYSNVEYGIPTRDEDGYGISKHTIDEMERQGINLVIILDCGIKAIDEIEYARTKGIDFIICDHHVADDKLPPAAAILNPKLDGSTYPCRDLSGCGVGFKFMQAFAISNGIDPSELYSLLDLVAVSIVADIVPITDENRILTFHGMRRLNSNPNTGLRAILKSCQLLGKELNISDVIFKIGPRINASGRMQSGREAVDLLVTRNFKEAQEIAANLDRYNQERKELDKQITAEASQYLADNPSIINGNRSIVVFNRDWHKGIIGIVASRLTELYYKPTVVLTMSNGLATGSARSVQGFDIYAAVESCRDLLENFGGHTYAVGLSLKEENIAEFTRRFEQFIADNITREQMVQTLEIDASITFSDLTNEFTSLLKRFNPYGPGNPKPTFCTRSVTDFGTSKLVGKNLEHIKLELVDNTSGKVMSGIAFNMAQHFEHITAGMPFDICYTIEENHHSSCPGAIQLLIKEIRTTDPTQRQS